MIVVSFLMLYPVLWLVASSFKPNGDTFFHRYVIVPRKLYTGALYQRLERLRRLYVHNIFSQIHFW